MNNIKIVALSAKAGAGKDWIFQNTLKQYGFMKWAFADHFKIWAVSRKILSYDQAYVSKTEESRNKLQKFGTEEGRDIYGKNIWLDTTFTWITHLSNTMQINKFCITDCRFRNEVDFVHSLGGKVYRIEAPTRVENSNLSVEARQHTSETELDNSTKFDGFLYNDPGIMSDTIKEQVDFLLKRDGFI